MEVFSLKEKEPVVVPLMHAIKCLQAESIMYDH